MISYGLDVDVLVASVCSLTGVTVPISSGASTLLLAYTLTVGPQQQRQSSTRRAFFFGARAHARARLTLSPV